MQIFNKFKLELLKNLTLLNFAWSFWASCLDQLNYIPLLAKVPTVQDYRQIFSELSCKGGEGLGSPR
jgi:hypothetical protein